MVFKKNWRRYRWILYLAIEKDKRPLADHYRSHQLTTVFLHPSTFFMGLIIFGIIVIIVGLALKRSGEIYRRFSGITRIVGLLAIALGILTACIIQIDAGNVGVKKLF